MNGDYSLPPVPDSSDWFPVRVIVVLGSGQYQFVEVQQVAAGIIADKNGGRINSVNDPGYAIDGSVFAVTAAASAVQVLARRAMGDGGRSWELKGFIGSIIYKNYGGTTDVGTFGVDTFNAQSMPGCSPLLSVTFASGFVQVGGGGVTITLGFNYDAAPVGAVGLQSILASLVLPANAYVPFSLVGFKSAGSTTVNVLYKIIAGSVVAVVVSGITAIPGTAL